jgi:membrane-associated HD superfamily phosphohydrolase
MSKPHNKKRNSGLLYEFLIKKISNALVENDKKVSSKCLRILKKHFKPGTELYKEFRIINALLKSTVSSAPVAASIMQEAKKAARSHDVNLLERQKSHLIKDINYILKDDTFFDQQVSEYKLFATIQSLINDWRDRSPDLERLASFEDAVSNHLLSEKKEVEHKLSSEQKPGESRLLMKVMMKKLNEKYSGILNDSQKSLIKAYAFSTASDDKSTIQFKLNEIKSSILDAIENCVPQQQKNTILIKKLEDAKQKILSEQIENVDDQIVTRFMLYTKLYDELTSKEDTND